MDNGLSVCVKVFRQRQKHGGKTIQAASHHQEQLSTSYFKASRPARDDLQCAYFARNQMPSLLPVQAAATADNVEVERQLVAQLREFAFAHEIASTPLASISKRRQRY